MPSTSTAEPNRATSGAAVASVLLRVLAGALGLAICVGVHFTAEFVAKHGFSMDALIGVAGIGVAAAVMLTLSVAANRLAYPGLGQPREGSGLRRRASRATMVTVAIPFWFGAIGASIVPFTLSDPHIAFFATPILLAIVAIAATVAASNLSAVFTTAN